MQSFRLPQDFYSIIYNQDAIITFPKDIIAYWKFNKDEWFSHKSICCKEMISTYIKNNYNIEMLFALLLQYDQLNRHPLKKYEDMCDECKSNIDKTEYETLSNVYYSLWKQTGFRFATNIALKIIHSNKWCELDEITHCFTLLCIRHNKNLNMKIFALKKLYKLMNNDIEKYGEISGLYLRFLQATIWDIQKFKYNKGFVNEGYVNKYDETHQPSKITIPECIESCMSFKDIIDERYSTNIEKADTHKDTNLKYYKYIYDDVKLKLIKKLNKIDTYTRDNDKQKQKANFIISISGGVDSMLVSYLLADIRSKSKQEFDITCIHISYNNRSECDREREFLRWWCKDIIKSKLFIREIDEIKRNRHSKLRSMYECITRRIRFDMYKYVCEELDYNYNDSFIVLGHNKDDTYENVFTNLAKQIHFDNLFGMKESSSEDEINLWRPLLDTTKSNIYKSAMEQNIPYLIDSTPKWSQRGKLRDELLPMLNKFNPQIMNGLDNYVKYTTLIHKQSTMLFKLWIKSSNIKLNMNGDNTILNIKYDKNDDTDYFTSSYKSNQFWVDIWFHFNLTNRPSNKSINNCITNITNILCGKLKRPMKISMNKKTNMYVTTKDIMIEIV